MTKKRVTLAPAAETGRLGISFLKRFWSYYILERNGQSNSQFEQQEFSMFTALLNALGLGLEPTIQFLFNHTPTFEVFEDWVMANGQVSKETIQLFNSLALGENKNNTLKKETSVLDEEDLMQWERDGYVIIRNAIPKKDCEDCVKMIYDFLEADQQDPSSWYNPHPLKKGIMVQLFNHPLLNKNRFSEKIRGAHQQLWKRKDLMVSMDRVSFNPPENKYYHFPGPNLHWDVSLKTPIPFGVQGLLYLVDTAANQGAFSLVPGFHRRIEDWLNSLPAGAHPREQDLRVLGVKPICANAGDFIIWHQALPHGSSPNTAQKPRIVQYINYQPLNREIQIEWI